jgi:hypothetical protein
VARAHYDAQMRLFAAPPLLTLLLIGACSSGPSAEPAATPSAPAPTASAAATGGLTQDACRVLTAADVQAALGVPVTQLPLTSPPPGAGPGGNLVSGCTYSSSSATAGGASLYLYRDMAIDYFATVPGFTAVHGVGDAAYEHVPMLIGRKGHVTFQLTVDSSADPAKADTALRALAHAAAARL